MKPTCSILVLNYNGKHLLEQFLPSVMSAADNASCCDVEVVVLDNQSTDASFRWVEQHCPGVKTLLAPSNAFLYSYNWAVNRIDSDLILLLNNDIEMTSGCLDPLFDVILADSSVFSVTPKMLAMDGVTSNGGRWVGNIHRGMLLTTIANTVEGVTPTLFSSGGACVIRREDFLSLGKFDDLYYPAYWEDVDLCYRAWKRGKASLYQPASVVYHMHSASMKADAKLVSRKHQIEHRNCWLFTWRNLSNHRILMQNLYWTLRHYAYLVRTGEKEILETYNQAFARYRKALVGRKYAERDRLYTDQDILRLIENAFPRIHKF